MVQEAKAVNKETDRNLDLDTKMGIDFASF